MLKFQDFVDVPYRDGLETELDTMVGPWSALRAQFPGIRIRRLYRSVAPGELQQLVSRAASADPSYHPPNFFTTFVVECPAGIDPAAVADALREWPSVEFAYVQPNVSLPAFVTSDPDLQGFHAPAPDGIDAFYAWEIEGSDGARQALVDLEAGWTLNHQDLALQGKAVILNGLASIPSWASHGTAVLGIICALDDGVGCVGIAPKATVNMVSHVDPDDPQLLPATKMIPDAITVALQTLTFGNVLLLEAQVEGTVNGVARWLPCEADPLCFLAIRLASALGIVVVEPAATNDADLDAFENVSGLQVLNPASADFLDSGAIVVGGATSTVPHMHLDSMSAHGGRLDCYAWAEDVRTCDSNALGSTTAYTSFGGTSAAAAIIAGAVLSIQGMMEASSRKRRLSPREIREILRDPANGTPVAGSVASRAIPNLGAIANVLEIAPDVYVRDFLGDAGAADGVSRARSPDIIVRTAAVGDAQASFGAGSGTEEDETLSDAVQSGQDNFVYVRALNRGASDASNVEVAVYWAEPSTLITPDAWHLIGSATIPNVPQGAVLTSSAAIRWPAADIPGPGHYCFIALVGNVVDPAPLWADFANWGDAQAWDHFVRFISVNNNVAWRNFDVVSPDGVGGSGDVELDFLMRGAFDRARAMGLEVVAQLPDGALIGLEAPEQFLDLWRQPSSAHRIRNRRALIPAARQGRLLLGPVRLPARAKVPLRILARIPDEARDRAYEVYVRQTCGEVEVGRVTWRLQRKEGARRLS